MAAAELYDDIGAGYSLGRRTNPRWMTAILAALGDARLTAAGGQRPAGQSSPTPAGRSSSSQRHEALDDHGTERGQPVTYELIDEATPIGRSQRHYNFCMDFTIVFACV